MVWLCWLMGRMAIQLRLEWLEWWILRPSIWLWSIWLSLRRIRLWRLVRSWIRLWWLWQLGLRWPIWIWSLPMGPQLCNGNAEYGKEVVEKSPSTTRARRPSLQVPRSNLRFAAGKSQEVRSYHGRGGDSPREASQVPLRTQAHR